LDGTHYGRTAEAWLQNMDSKASAIKPLFLKTYGREAERFTQYWRVFFMACEELWNYSAGREWLVSHYLFRKP
jgi:cyclopropane-fatty-acyl-phospholipid synthase